MCIRAIDYCPPVNITFGDFLRGIITADLDADPSDQSGFRIVFIESFREWGIYPRGVNSMGLDALAWPTGDQLMRERIADGTLEHMPDVLKSRPMTFAMTAAQRWNLESDRFQVWNDMEDVRTLLHNWLRDGDSFGRDYARLFGLEMDDAKAPPTVSRSRGEPAVEIHAARPTLRRTKHGTTRTDLLVEITQSRAGYFDPQDQARMDDQSSRPSRHQAPDFRYRAGATVIIDPATFEVRRIIRTPGTIADSAELDRVRRFLLGEFSTDGNSFDAGIAESLRARDAFDRDEPFAMLHQLEELT
jgi:hypothetical protein